MNNVKNIHLIWEAHPDFIEWKDELKNEYPSLDDDQLYDKMLDINNEYIDDERVNLDITLNRPIIVIADLGLWNGRRCGYKEIKSGNISECLYSDCDYNTWYVDEFGDLRCKAEHHDGTNYYLYRTYREEATEEQIEDLKYKLYCGKATAEDIALVTKRLGDAIGEVYGWEFPEESAK